MSWSSFEELKKFARKGNIVKKKRPATGVGWQNPTVSKRRRTDNGSLSFTSNTDTGEIEGFSTDEEGENAILDSDSDTALRSELSKPYVKRKYSKRQTLSDKTSTSAESDRIVDDVHKGSELHGCKTCDFPDGANYELLQYGDVLKEEEEEIDWCASDNEAQLPQVFSEGSESDISETKVPVKPPGWKLFQGNAATKVPNDETNVSGEVISDFQSDQETSQESLSADISTPTPTPVSPVVVGSPRTATEWLKQIQKKSPQKSEQNKSPECRGAGMNQYDSAKKKRKFVRSGLAEQLQHIITREKSEKAFWSHQIMERQKEHTGSSIQADGSVTVQILHDQLQSSLHFTQCCVLCEDSDSPRDPQQRIVFVLFTCETWKQLGMQIGDTVIIYPPWQKLDIPGVPFPVLLCTFFCEKQPGNLPPAKNLQSVRGDGLLIPLKHSLPSISSLARSPKKGFKPSKLLFGSTEDTCTQKKLDSSTLTTVTPGASNSTIRQQQQVSILNAIESCGGYSGAVVTFQCLIQRVYCRRITFARNSKGNSRCTGLLYQDLKSVAKAVDDVHKEELRWTLLVQDIHGVCAEIQIPAKYQDLPDWRSCIQQGEGKVFCFSNVRVQQRSNRVRSPGLFSIIQSLWPSSDNTVIYRPNRSSQILTQESGAEAVSSNLPPNFCYVLTVQDSSQAILTQDADSCSLGLLHKPCVRRTLWHVLHEKKDDPERISVLCKLLYCRLSPSATAGEGHHSTFELFVTDSSLLKEAKCRETTNDMCQCVKIAGNSYHVLPKELGEAGESFGTILCVKHLLFRENQELMADTYSVIKQAVPESSRITHSGCTFYEETLPQHSIDCLSSLKAVAFPCLTRSACYPGCIYRVEGVVIGVDEESACCWLVCDMCGSADITCKQGTSQQFFCALCRVAVNSPKTKTHLAVFVKVKSFPQANVKVTLQQSTIDKLLPVSYQDSDQGYDVEVVLGKQLEPMTCYVTECSEQHDGCASSFCLEEVLIA